MSEYDYGPKVLEQYNWLCMACIYPIDVECFSYGKQCECVFHVECLASTSCPLHGEGYTLTTYSQESQECLLGCGKCHSTPKTKQTACYSCNEIVHTAIVKTCHLLKDGKPPPKPLFLLEDVEEPEQSTSNPHSNTKGGAPIQSVYSVIMRHGNLWPPFFLKDNVIKYEDVDPKTMKLSVFVHPIICIMWDYVWTMIVSDATFYVDYIHSKVWMTVLWLEKAFLGLRTAIYKYPDVMLRLSDYKRCVRERSEQDVQLVHRLLRIHFRDSDKVIRISKNELRKTTRYNIYSVDRLKTEVLQNPFGGIHITDVYAEDQNAYKFVQELVSNRIIIVICSRLYYVAFNNVVKELHAKLTAQEKVENEEDPCEPMVLHEAPREVFPST